MTLRVQHRFGGMRDEAKNRGGMWDTRNFKGGIRDENKTAGSGYASFHRREGYGIGRENARS